jgi:hypothetical protein
MAEDPKPKGGLGFYGWTFVVLAVGAATFVAVYFAGWTTLPKLFGG